MANTTKIPLVLAITPDYIVPAATVIMSIANIIKPGESYEVYFLCSQPLSVRQENLLRGFLQVDITLIFKDLSGVLADLDADPRYSIATYYRMLIPLMITEYEQVIYLDSDIILRNSLSELFYTPEAGKYMLAAVREATLGFQEAHVAEMGIPQGEYINTGVLLMNLPLLRQNRISEKFCNLAKLSKTEFPDQDLINKLCNKSILAVGPWFNGLRTMFLPQYKRDFLRFYSEQDWYRVQKEGNIHYTGDKPWKAFTVHFYEWWDTFYKLPLELRDEGKGLLNERMRTLYLLTRNVLTRKLILGAVSLYRNRKYKIQ